MEYTIKSYDEDVKIANWIFNKYFLGYIRLKEDMVQAAVIKLWRNRPHFNKRKGTYGTFACLCAYREMCMFLRKEKKHLNNISLFEEIEEDILLIDILGAVKDSMSELLEVEELLSKVRIVVSGLDGKSKKIIELYLKHYPQREIAKRVGVSQVSVSSHIKAFRKLLKAELEGD